MRTYYPKDFVFGTQDNDTYIQSYRDSNNGKKGNELADADLSNHQLYILQLSTFEDVMSQILEVVIS